MASPHDAALDRLVDLDRAREEEEFYANASESCDVCRRSFENEKYMVDGELKGTPTTQVAGETVGQWGCVCSQCFARVGVGIKWGTGQLYLRQSDGEWLMVAGFRPKKD